MPAPRFLGYPALLGEPTPINWQGIGQALWDSNLNAPIRGAYNLMNTPAETLLYDTGAAGEQAVADAFDAGGGITVGSMPIPKPSNSVSMGIKAYHGSPHSFDKFSMDKIGTGEGAQAYGHGLYFAENEGVAHGYRAKLSTDTPEIQYGDKTYRIMDRADRDRLVQDMTANGVDPKEADYIAGSLRINQGYVDRVKAKMVARDADHLLPAMEGLTNRPRGSMYEVNIDADPNAFLDWDKPLSEQPEAVREALQKGWLAHPDVDARKTGAEIYNGLGRAEWGNTATPDGSAKALKEAGIPGIKYLDAGSRGQKYWVLRHPQGGTNEFPDEASALAFLKRNPEYKLEAPNQSRNFVVFDDKLISIVRKYGIAGASAMLGYDVLTGANEAQAKAVNKADLDHRYDNFLKSGGI